MEHFYVFLTAESVLETKLKISSKIGVQCVKQKVSAQFNPTISFSFDFRVRSVDFSCFYILKKVFLLKKLLSSAFL